MIKVADAVREIVDHDPALKTGLAQKLMNLSQVARHIHSTVVARTHKDVQLSAITMALSRLRADLPSFDAKFDLGLADRITVQRGLVVLTFPNTARVHSGLLRLQETIRKARSYLTITEGIREITLIIERAMLDRVHAGVGERPARVARGIVAYLRIRHADRDRWREHRHEKKYGQMFHRNLLKIVCDFVFKSLNHTTPIAVDSASWLHFTHCTSLPHTFCILFATSASACNPVWRPLE